MATPEQLAVMAEHYLIAAIWAECPEGTHPRATRQARDKALQVCEAFAAAAGPLLEEAATRDGYGAHPDCGTVHPAYAGCTVPQSGCAPYPSRVAASSSKGPAAAAKASQTCKALSRA